MAFSPVEITSPDDLAHDDFRRHSPRFQGENFQRNLELVERVREIAAEKDCTPGQLALAWVLAQGEDVVPIPGTKRRSYLEQNVAASELSLSAGGPGPDRRGRPRGLRARGPLPGHVLGGPLSA